MNARIRDLKTDLGPGCIRIQPILRLVYLRGVGRILLLRRPHVCRQQCFPESRRCKSSSHCPQSKTDSLQRAVGIGYQQEVIARLQNHTLGYSGSQINVTLDNNTVTFPLNQSLYFDFSHDTNIASIITAFGFKQFAQLLQPTEYPGPHNFTVSHITPFGARLDIEIIRTPKPFKADRSGYDESGGETKYIHFVLNQRTLPLGWSFPECDVERKDGWCELETFLKVQEEMPGLANYDKACHGEIETVPYGVVYDGRPM